MLLRLFEPHKHKLQTSIVAIRSSVSTLFRFRYIHQIPDLFTTATNTPLALGTKIYRILHHPYLADIKLVFVPSH